MERDRWQRIECLFRELVELPEEQRKARLDELRIDASPTEEAVQAEVESLLAAHGRSGAGFLEELHLDGRAAVLESLATSPLPQRIGPYRIDREIGRGGMGVVYLAERVDGAFEQRVALKLVKRGMDTDAIVRRFVYERQILARLEHPNIARLLDGGVTDRGQPWFALELVDGTPLTDWCDQQQLELDERVRLFERVCGAVAYAHRNLVVHRDLKPSNVLVTPGGEVKLLDFGIAKLLATDGDPMTHFETEAGSRMATPEYSAPEQLSGGRVSTATDVYSLGAILCEVLCGAKPFELRSRALAPALETLTASEPQRPSTQASAEAAIARGTTKRRLERALRGDLDTIVLKALRLDPERRYSGSEELAKDLRRYRRGLPVLAQPDRWSYRSSRFVRRHWLGVAMTTLLIASLSMGLIGMAWLGQRLASERDRSRIEAQRTDQVKEFIIELFRASEPSESRGEQLTANEILNRGLARIDDEFATEPDLRADLLASVANALIALGDFEQGRELYERALPLLDAADPQAQLRRAEILNGLGEAYAHLDRLDEAEATHRHALELRERVAGSDSLEASSSHNNLGVALAMQRKWRDAETHYRRSIAVQQLWLPDDDVDLLATRTSLALTLRYLGKYSDAERILRSVDEKQRETVGADHPTRIATLNTLASVLVRRGRYGDAERMYEDSIAIATRVLGQQHPSTLGYKNNHAVLLLKMGNGAKAEQLLREVLAEDIRRLGLDHSYVAMDRDNLGRALTDLGRFEEARAQYDLAERVHRAADPKGGLLATSRIRRAETLLASGSPVEAATEIDLALEILVSEQDPEPDKLAEGTALSGEIRLALGDTIEAERLLRSALSDQEEALGTRHPDVATTRLKLGDLLVATDRPDEAVQQIEHASAIWKSTLPEDHWRHGEALVSRGLCELERGKLEEGDRKIRSGLQHLERTRGADDWRTRSARRRASAPAVGSTMPAGPE